VLLVASVLGPLAKDARVRAAAAKAAEARGRPHGRDGDAADAIATIVRDVATDREAVLAETRAAAAERAASADSARAASAAAEARRSTPPGELEDLGGEDFAASVSGDLGDLGGDGHAAASASTPPPPSTPSGPDPAMLSRLRTELNANEVRLRKELAEVRADADRWAERRTLAEKRGDRGLAADAGREADRKRARVQVILEDLARIAAERQRLAHVAGGATIEDELDAMKRSQRHRVATVEDELAALKKKMHSEGKKK
jgi:hypothetical protein